LTDIPPTIGGPCRAYMSINRNPRFNDDTLPIEKRGAFVVHLQVYEVNSGEIYKEKVLYTTDDLSTAKLACEGFNEANGW
jgi:hypothetical protein